MKFLKVYSVIARVLLALIFLLSGIAKAVNPYGFSVKVGEYLTAMNADFLSFSVPVFAISVPAVEIILALFLLYGFFPRISSWTVVVLTSFFTVLTFWNLISDAVGDCGCFGDVIKLSPMVSFLKNISILITAVVYHLSIEYVQETTANIKSRILCFVVCSFGFPVYVYRHLPLYESSEYSKGAVLYQESVVSPKENDQSQGSDGMSLLYRNRFSGEICNFRLEDDEWQDSIVWEFVGIEDTKIANVPFPMLRDDFYDVSADVLSTSDSLLIVIVQKPDLKKLPDMHKVRQRVIALSAFDLSSLSVEHYSSDFSLLKQIMPNSNGGALLVYKGKILDKWAMLDCPYFKEASQDDK